MIVRDQNWARACPWMGVITLVLLFLSYGPHEPIFWALVNIPLYLFHQTEEHCWPGGFKHFINQTVLGLPEGQETLTDVNIFWINILFVWFAFAVLGTMVLVNIGYGLVIVLFSVLNCLLHIIMGLKYRRWNPGLVVATLQFIVSIYAGYFITSHGLNHPIPWWGAGILFSIIVHALLFICIKRSMPVQVADQ